MIVGKIHGETRFSKKLIRPLSFVLNALQRLRIDLIYLPA
jgi:hypothetical protein